jgi:sec-independent protein translocase protein TatA
MFEGALSPLHWLVVLVIALLIFGPRKLPELGKGLGSAIRGFREGLHGLEDGQDQPAPPSPGQAVTPAPTDAVEAKK